MSLRKVICITFLLILVIGMVACEIQTELEDKIISLGLSEDIMELEVGETSVINIIVEPEGVDLNYSSSEPGVAIVNEGIVEAIGKGTAKISIVASKEGYSSAEVELWVYVLDFNAEFAFGSGTEQDPYLIGTAEQLDNMRKTEHLDKYFKLIANIDLSSYSEGTGWEPINIYHIFTGSFNGNGYIISNLTIDRPSSNNVALFAKTSSDATIKNVGLENVNIRGDLRVGGLVGENEGQIINSYVTGVIKGESSWSNAGGLVGTNRGNITTSYANANVTGEGRNVGGLIGQNYGDVTESYALGEILGDERIGGLIGYNEGDVTESYATGMVTSDLGHIGGLLGENKGGNISESYALGDVIAGANYAGGLVGYNYENGFITASHAEGNVTGDGTIIGGLVGGNMAGDITNSYAIGDVIGANQVGGLVGNLSQSVKIVESFATGAVTGNGGSNFVGGLVGSNAGEILRSYASGMVKAEGDAWSNAGGLVGNNVDQGLVLDSYATGSIEATNRAGGLVGLNDNAITNSYAIGEVIGSGSNVGGLVGQNNGDITDSYYDQETTKQNDEDKGIPKLTADMMTEETFTNWDFNNIWTIIDSYPYLLWQEN